MRARVAAVLVGVACAAPLAYLMVLSVAAAWPFPRLLPSQWTVERWADVLTGRGALAHSLGLSVAISLTVAAWSTAAGFVTARHIAYSPHRRALLLLAYVPFAMSPVVLGTTLLHLFIRLGLAATVPGVVAAQAMFAYGFATIFFMGLWNPEKRAYEEMVYTLGGGAADAFRHALLPLARPMLALCFFQSFLISWFQYGITLLVGSGKVKTLPLQVFDAVNEANVGLAAVAGCLLVAPPLLLLAFRPRGLERVP